jgi:hypothetical protein
MPWLDGLLMEKCLKPMPWRRWPLGLVSTFTGSEVAAIKHGFQPGSMDDKWLIRSIGDWVYFHRSWTGSCIFAVQLRVTPQGGATIGRSWVSRNRRDYRGFPLDEERKMCRSLIDRLLLSNDLRDSGAVQ